MKVALIFGVTGQDGSYLSEFLLKKNTLFMELKENLHLSTLVELIVFLKRIKNFTFTMEMSLIL